MRYVIHHTPRQVKKVEIGGRGESNISEIKFSDFPRFSSEFQRVKTGVVAWGVQNFVANA
jgi:hypothetical protein